MKKFIQILCLAIVSSIALSGCRKNEDFSVESTYFTEGRFLWGENGDALIIIENTGPCTMGTDEDGIFKEFTDGDLIEIEYDGYIAETYPGQISKIYNAKLKEDGQITDIDPNILEELTSMGWLE